MRLSGLSLFAFAVLGVLGGCEEPSDDPVNTTLSVETPSTVRFATVGRVEYRATSSAGAASAGTFERAALGPANPSEDGQRPVIWRSELSLPVDDYVLELAGLSLDGDVVCVDEIAFAVAADLPTELYQRMTCNGPPGDPFEPVGDAILTLYAPDRSGTGEIPQFEVSVSCGEPAEESELVYLSALPLASEGVADFGSGPVSTNIWRAELTDLPPGPCRVEITRSPRSADRHCNASVDFNVTADQTTPVSLVLPCDE